ncbi:dihydrofolate reductase [Halosquirtibacter laminarini]|uniref:Dihydrofolate reductase n=1 Tax=Halosquirtibacter laminarini TaxID=3374600 RepID=A0AC61NN27_9BACT|nr:dihydrofolate reductase [Prolixibacteraceae bacterium]
MACEIAMIAAVDREMGIGKSNDMLFFISEDLKRFKSLTTGYPIVMGRKTFESLPKGALPNRRNVVMSSQKNLVLPGAEVVHSMEEAIALLSDETRCFIIGGGVIYREFMPMATHLFITHIEDSKEADTFFPVIPPKDWNACSETVVEATEKHPMFRFVDYQRV